jgi:hypothetical protein
MHMSGESLLVVLVVGLIAGWLAGQIVQGTGFGIVTRVGPRNASWFTRDSISASKDDGRPDRLPTAPTISLAAGNQPQSELIG